MSKASSARYYPKKKKKIKKNLVKNIEIFPKKKKETKRQYGREQYTEISLKMKNKSKLITEKDTLKS